MTAAGRPDEPPAAEAPRRRGCRAWLIVAIVVLALLGGGLLRWASRPQQVAHLVLGQAGRALGLRITAKGVSEYTLRGTPQLVLREVTAQRDGDAAPVLTAQRLLLSIPWSTLKSRGREITVHRIELDRPALDIGAMQRWLATRPPSPARPTPTLTDGLSVTDGRVIGEGWTIESLRADVPRLAPRRPVHASLRGRVVAGETRMPFNVVATLMRPELPAGLGIAGDVAVERPEWRLPMNLVVQGVPGVSGELALHAMVLRANARYVATSAALPFELGIAGDARYAKGLHVAPFGLALRQGREIPDMRAGGSLDWTTALELHLAGRIDEWPAGWPELPEPIGRPRGPLPMQLDYAGPTDLSGGAALELASGRTRFEGRFRLPRILAWLDPPPRGNPLPPLDGRVTTPRLEIPGATLEGVDVEFRDDE
jgi:hypothetical protein